MFAAENARLRKNRIGSIGSGVRSSHATKATSSTAPADERTDDLRARPAVAVAVDQAPDDAEQADADERRGRAGRAPCRGPKLSRSAQRERQQHEADRDVEPEDPLPRDALDDGAADERAHRDREAGDARPGAERDAAPLGGNGRR